MPAVVVGLFLLGAVGTGAAIGPDDRIDECTNANEGPGERGPSASVAESVPDVPSVLFDALPVPNFVRGLFGAGTC